jgi:hypothetical protein
MDNRLRCELEAGLVRPEDNKGWLVAENNAVSTQLEGGG